MAALVNAKSSSSILLLGHYARKWHTESHYCFLQLCLCLNTASWRRWWGSRGTLADNSMHSQPRYDTEVNGQLHVMAALPARKYPAVSTGQGVLEMRQNCFPCQQTHSGFSVYRLAITAYLFSYLTTLFRLLRLFSGKCELLSLRFCITLDQLCKLINSEWIHGELLRIHTPVTKWHTHARASALYWHNRAKTPLYKHVLVEQTQKCTYN